MIIKNDLIIFSKCDFNNGFTLLIMHICLIIIQSDPILEWWIHGGWMKRLLSVCTWTDHSWSMSKNRHLVWKLDPCLRNRLQRAGWRNSEPGDGLNFALRRKCEAFLTHHSTSFTDTVTQLPTVTAKDWGEKSTCHSSSSSLYIRYIFIPECEKLKCDSLEEKKNNYNDLDPA